jgi:hypothetical protein
MGLADAGNVTVEGLKAPPKPVQTVDVGTPTVITINIV